MSKSSHPTGDTPTAETSSPPTTGATPAPEPAPEASPAPTPAATADDRVAELTADVQRLQAEFMNYRRRAEAEKADLTAFATTRVVRQFLAVRDSFDQELAHRPAGADPGWAESIDAIRAQFDQVLTGLGVARFESLGQPFDPHRHEALAIADGEGDHEVVVEELQPGYQLGETVLRPAMVKVGRVSQE